MKFFAFRDHSLCLAALISVWAALGSAAASNAADFDQAFFNQKPPEQVFALPRDKAEAQRQDIDYFKNFLELDLSYTKVARATAQQRLNDLASKAGNLSAIELHLGLARVAALAANGHSRVLFSRGLLADGQPYPMLPFVLEPFGSEYCVVRTMDQAKDLLGGCVTEIDGTPIKAIVQKFRDAFGSTTQQYPYGLVQILRRPDFLFAAGVTKHADAVEIGYTSLSGERCSRSVQALPAEAFGSAWTVMTAMPKPSSAKDEKWSSLLQADHQLPLYLRHPDEWYVRERLPRDGYYLQLKITSDVGSQSIKGFLEETLNDIRAAHPRFIIVDLRFNAGGNLQTTSNLLKQLPELVPPEGSIYVLTNGQTFSAAITSASVIKQAGGVRTKIVGEMSGDRQRYWAEGNDLCLPNSKICAHYSRGLHDYAKSCLAELGCYYSALVRQTPDIGLIDLSVPSLEPDINAPMTFADYAAGRDPAFTAVMTAVERTKR